MRGMGAPVAAPSNALKYIFYIVAALTIVYLVSRLTFNGASQDIAVTTTTQTGAPTSGPVTLKITEDARIRIKSGGEYTFSFWIYINSWGDRGSKPSNVLTIKDAGIADAALMAVMLYPTEPMMAIRLYTGPNSNNYTNKTARENLLAGTLGSLSGPKGAAPSCFLEGQTPSCDLQDIDMQRWLNITVSTNGRVVDVYYDGKLARSCVLPQIIQAGAKGLQSVVIGEAGGFQGSFGVMNYFAYTLTPDRIYSIYLAGPGGPPTFLSYLESKLGVNISYTGATTSGSDTTTGSSSCPSTPATGTPPAGTPAAGTPTV